MRREALKVKSKPFTPAVTRQALHSWKALNNLLRTCTEKEATGLLRAEQVGRQRRWILLRIYGRYNELRIRREKLEIIQAFIARRLEQ